ncbi:hypothetical protein C1H46_022253 [Malus baccata]|uniref:glucan endo-1,3-beta-D-glucosidase n=1 Tax=Malus baccata TaxID=106549 RepID=A0A540M090_MALBA|nr:hypothetical protein C1H46_022253 [Malus baccata]
MLPNGFAMAGNVGVGNEPYLTSYNGTYVKTTYPALKNIQKALDESGAGGKVKATVPFNADVYESTSNKPSDGCFRKDIKNNMVEILRHLRDSKAPFVVNIYPFLSLYQNADFPQEFAFFEGGSKPVRDNNIEYKNVFDANCDTLVNALKKEGFGNMEIVIGEVGWPTDGDKSANIKNAKKFYDGLLKKLGKEEGTPLRKGKIEVYLFGLFDEDQKSVAPGDFERHWGIFRYDGQPKFPMDLSGKGSGNQMLKAVQGVEYLDKQWCVLNSSVKNLSQTQAELNYACAESDCTSLGSGRSCNLDQQGNVSYAFNIYFQTRDQDVRACDFNGTATITRSNPSVGDCLFPVQIVGAGASRHGAVGAAYALSIFAGLFLEHGIDVRRMQNNLDNGKNDMRKVDTKIASNVTAYLHDGGVTISYVAVGNEPFLTSNNGTFVKDVYPSVKNVQKALDEAGVGGKIKCVVPFNADVYESPSNKPSDGRFRKDIKKSMSQILEFLRTHKSPFVVNIYPFLSLSLSSGFPKEFAFFDGGGKPVRDNGAQYSNVFDANYDTLLWALKKAGVPNLDIVIGEVGWPTDGHDYANSRLANKFYDGLLKKLASQVGTPLRKGYLEVYLFGLFDEDEKSIAPGDFERHWGIFRYDGKPKFPMDLSGQASGHQMLKGVEGVKYLRKQWCVLNSDVRNLSRALAEFNYACSQADCTSLGGKRSCDLEMHDTISFAFNEFYQKGDQDYRKCDFSGMGTKVTRDPSKGDCLFRIQIDLPSAAGQRHALSYAYASLLFVIAFFTLF